MFRHLTDIEHLPGFHVRLDTKLQSGQRQASQVALSALIVTISPHFFSDLVSCFDPSSSSLLCVPGAESDGGSQAACFAGGCQDCPSMVHQGPEDESHLSHSEPLQHRCHSEVSDCWDLVPCVRSRLHSVCPASGHGEDTFLHTLILIDVSVNY